MPGFSIDRKTLYVIIAVFIILTIINLGSFNLVITLLTLPGVILAMSFHEFAHAFVAYKLGDPTPKNQGRVTLDPMKHLDPVGLFLLIFAHLGWGKPVEINPNNFSRISKEKGEVLVALAGPLMNFILAFILTCIYYAISIFGGIEVLVNLSNINVAIVCLTILYYAIIVNIGLGVFNLLPIPPLDGSKIFLRLLPRSTQNWISDNMYYIQIAFMILFITNILSYITSPVIEIVMNGIEFLVSLIFGIFI